MSDAGSVIYLDYAATSAVRPDRVIHAVTTFLSQNGASPGRGGHRLAIEADRTALHCRQALAKLLDIPGDAGRIAFFPNATYAINTALHGTLRHGDRVVITTYDHNAVLRPVRSLASQRALDVVMVQGDASGALDLNAYARAVDGARVVVLNGASNVLGTSLDIPSLAATARAAGAMVLVDAAQVAGEMPFSVAASGADMVAITGHKGLLGPPGTGGLWVRDGIEIDALVTGGTGGDSMDPFMPASYPDHLEAGSQNGAGIAGLGAGVDWLLEHDVARVHARTTAHARALHSGLSALPSVRVLSPLAPRDRPGTPIVTFVAARVDPGTMALRLDREFGVLARAGLHCAPEVHRMLGTADTGAVRMSAGWATTDEDIDSAIRAVATILGEV